MFSVCKSLDLILIKRFSKLVDAVFLGTDSEGFRQLKLFTFSLAFTFTIKTTFKVCIGLNAGILSKSNNLM